jgi:hypothetical protein
LESRSQMVSRRILPIHRTIPGWNDVFHERFSRRRSRRADRAGPCQR